MIRFDNERKLITADCRMYWVLVITTVITVIVAIYCITSGVYIVFQNLFYFPIIIACFYFSRDGFVFSTALACLYLLLIVGFTRDSIILLLALIRFVIFIIVAGIIDYFIKMKTRLEMLSRIERDDFEDLLQNKISGLDEELKTCQHTKEILRKNKESLDKTIQSIGDAVVVTDNRGYIIEMNNAAERLSGWTFSESRSKSITDIIKIIDVETRNVDNSVLKVIETGSIKGIANHMIMISRNGNEYHIISTAVPIIDNSVAAGVVLIFSDITEKHKAENMLRENEEFYRNMIEYSNDMIWTLDTEGNFLFFNKHSEDITGYKLNDFRGKSFAPLIVKEDLPKVIETFHKILNGQYQNYEVSIINKNNDIMVLLVNTAPVYSRGKITGTVSFGKDITDRKLMENKLKTSLKEKEILLSELYHRTKNNMQVISSMLVLQATVCNDENVKRVINNVTVKIKAMSLVHQKLFQSKDLSNIKLKEYIGEVVQVIIQIYEKNNKVTVEEKIDDISVLIDIATPLGLIISELVSNSFKHAFSKDKNGIIKINIFKDSKNNIEIRYSDNGGGLTDNFDFESTKCLGLKIIKDLVRYQLQGNIDYINDGGFVCIIRFLDNLYKQRV